MGYTKAKRTFRNHPSSKASFENYEVEHDFSSIGRRIMLLDARQIQTLIGNENHPSGNRGHH